MKTEIIERLLCLLDVRMHALALCEVSRGVRLKLPGMESVLVHYVLEGSGVIVSEEGVKVEFGPDALIFLPPGCGHEIAETGQEPELLVWKEIAEPIGDGMMKFADGADPVIVTACGTISADCEGLDLFARLREPVLEPLSGHPAVRAAFEIITRELQRPRFGTKPLIEALMKQCLILSLRNQVERGEMALLPFFGGGDPRLVHALLNLMEDPAREHTVDELAAASGMSRSLFSERFAEAFERPPMDLLKQIRLHRAANLLRSTGLPVQVVGMTVGYASRSYFSRAFRAAYGRDPKTFRDEARAELSTGAAGSQTKER
jgi:AraC-like DNA-binding protein